MRKIEQLFGEAVRKRRLKLGLSQEGFAAKAGIHRTYVSSIELGKVGISISIAQKLAAEPPTKMRLRRLIKLRPYGMSAALMLSELMPPRHDPGAMSERDPQIVLGQRYLFRRLAVTINDREQSTLLAELLGLTRPARRTWFAL